MTASVSASADRSRLTVIGELDAARPEVRAAFAELAGSDVTIDMSGALVVRASALTEFMTLRRRLKDSRIVVFGARPAVLRTLNAVGFNKLFEIQAGPR